MKYSLRVALVLLLLCTSTPSTSNEVQSLATARANFQRTGQFSTHTPSLVSNISWTGTAGQDFTSIPILEDDKVYYVDGVGLRVFSQPNARHLWAWVGYRRLGEYSYPAVDPVIYGNTVYLSLWSGGPGTALVALDKNSGDQLWSIKEEVKGGGASPIFYLERIMFGRGEFLICIDRQTRKELWRRQEIATVRHLTLAGHTIIVRFSSNTTIQAASAHDGSDLWRTELWRSQIRQTGPLGYIATSGGLAFIGTQEGVVALETETGKVRWNQVGLEYTRSELAVDESSVYGGSRAGVFALDKNTGEIKWLKKHINTYHSSPSIVGEILYATAGSHLIAVDTGTGELLADIEGEFRNGVGPVPGSGIVIVPGGHRYEDKLYMIH